MNRKNVPIFFACDDNFVKFTLVAFTSLKANANTKDFHYDIHILHTEISARMKKELLALGDENFTVIFDNVKHFLSAVHHRLHVRDYYSKTTYYRLFIPDLYPELDKAIYIDSDTIVLGDISELYSYELGENFVGACNEQAMTQEDVFGTYVEKVMGISRWEYFNAGVLLLNCKKFREKKVLDKFMKLLHEYTFVVTQDEDYLNLICKGKVLWVDNNWNMEVFGQLQPDESKYKLIHYIMVAKPWHYEDCRLKQYFWKYAEQTTVIDEIRHELETYPQEKKDQDALGAQKLVKTAIEETNRPDNWLNRQTLIHKIGKRVRSFIEKPDGKQSEDRLRILKKIDEYELAGRFDEDVEADPPTIPIVPGQVDYEQKKLSSRIKSHFAFNKARQFLRRQEKKKKFILKGVEGLENVDSVEGGAFITCNHFNAMDSFAVQSIYEEIIKRRKKLNRHNKNMYNTKSRFFRVIREGNYTNFPGFFGMLMRNCNTLPLAANHKVMNEFMTALKNLTAKGDFILIYPEQSMWWNYRKPKPLKKGTFLFAAKNNVPVIPAFITMEDSDIIDSDGFPVQEYTIHICKPIFCQEGFTQKENIDYMMYVNYTMWKDVYEKVYGIPLVYETEEL